MLIITASQLPTGATIRQLFPIIRARQVARPQRMLNYFLGRADEDFFTLMNEFERIALAYDPRVNVVLGTQYLVVSGRGSNVLEVVGTPAIVDGLSIEGTGERLP